MEFRTMAVVEVWYERQRELSYLRWEARNLCNALCHKLDWKRERQVVERINRILARARVRLARREALA